MRVLNGHMRRLMIGAAAAIVSMAGFICLGGTAQAASPAWKLVAVTGPTNLPPQQSEVQQLTVEADGGTFRLGRFGQPERVEHVEGTGTPVVAEAHLGLTAGSAVATIESLATTVPIEVGDRVTLFEEYEPQEVFIVSCSADCEAVGSTLELSEAASTTESDALRQIYTKYMSGVTGSFQVGDEVVGAKFGGFFHEYLPPGSAVTEAGTETLKLTKPTTFEYVTYEEELELSADRVVPEVPAELTAPLAIGDPALKIQEELEALPFLGVDAVTVFGGPGDGEHPYFINFGGLGGEGPFADQNVAPLELDTSGLLGATANAHIFTNVPGGAGTGAIAVDPANVGGAPSQGVVTVNVGPLPAGIEVVGATKGSGRNEHWSCPEGTGQSTITCTSNQSVPALHPAETLTIPVRVAAKIASKYTAPVEISGGGTDAVSYELPVTVSSDRAPFGMAAFWAGAFDADGTIETQAGGHPYSAQTFFLLNTVRAGTGQIVPAGVLKSTEVELPPGFSGNPLATARCPQNQLVGELVGQTDGRELCTSEMIVGVLAPNLNGFGIGAEEFTVPIYNDVPARGSAAEFSAVLAWPTQSLLGSLRSEKDFGVNVVAPNIANIAKIYGTYAALNGEPDAAHGRAFLTNPTDCAEQARSQPFVNLLSEAYELPGVVNTSTVPIPPVVGCDKVQFQPDFSFRPASMQGASPTGATAELHIDQEGLTDPAKLATGDLKKAVVALPQGLDVNPSSANGLESCSETQVGYKGPGELPNPTRFTNAPVTCPDASKLGTFQVNSPLLEEELEGTIYLAAQEENPFHSLIALYLVVESERFGVTLKLPGEVTADPDTGQLTATFDNNPQLPFEDLRLHFRGGGGRATLATPEVCGTYRTTGELTPWSAPESGPPVQIAEGGFTIASNCAASPQARPFAPTLEAGTTGTQAGSYSPLVIKLMRKDGEQEIRTLEFTLPKGLIGKLAGIPYCPDSAIAEIRDKSGKAEQADASCPVASQIGSVGTLAGVGSEPIHVGGKIYLAGPYEGAPLSSVVVTPAVAGPFDLGNVVVRAPLYVDPETAEITAKSDPIPSILEGIPLKLRSVVINLDRPAFTLNPTSCDPMEVTATVGGDSGGVAKPANRFQVGGCNQLRFKPKLKVSLRGSTKRTGLPALKAVLTYPKVGAFANIARAQVNLPHSEFLEQGNLGNTCTKPVLLEAKCPKKSIYGYAKAWTPLLEEPLEGPVYLVGGYGYQLPALVAELDGQIRVVLKGKVDSGPNRGIRNTFEAIPDAPVSRFVLEMKGGKKYGLLINSENLCKKPQRLLSRFTAQNGKVSVSKPLIATSCRRIKGKKPQKRH